jgi:hypothetical protein
LDQTFFLSEPFARKLLRKFRDTPEPSRETFP